MTDHLACLIARGGEASAVDCIVESRFQLQNEVFTSIAFLAIRLGVIFFELLLGQIKSALASLFRSQLTVVFRFFAHRILAVLAGDVRFPQEGAFLSIAAITFQK